jgi:hypothetical protein
MPTSIDDARDAGWEQRTASEVGAFLDMMAIEPDERWQQGPVAFKARRNSLPTYLYRRAVNEPIGVAMIQTWREWRSARHRRTTHLGAVKLAFHQLHHAGHLVEPKPVVEPSPDTIAAIRAHAQAILRLAP